MHNNLDKFQKHYAKWRMQDKKDYILCISIYVEF